MSADFPAGPGEVATLILCHVEEGLAGIDPPVTRRFAAAGLVPVDDGCGQLNVVVERIWRTRDGSSETRGYEQCTELLALDLLVMLTRCIPSADPASQGRRAATEDALAGAYDKAMDAGTKVWSLLAGSLPGEEWETIGLAQDYLAGQGGSIVIETRMSVVLGGVTAWACE